MCNVQPEPKSQILNNATCSISIFFLENNEIRRSNSSKQILIYRLASSDNNGLTCLSKIPANKCFIMI